MIDLLLFLIGCLAGALANWAIYRLALINPRPISPWSRLKDPQSHWTDFLPVVGWWFQRRLAEDFGRGFWLRPLLIELTCGLGLPALRTGIKTGIFTVSESFAAPAPLPMQLWIWLAFYYLLLILLIAATFIDFDEKTIPDEITLTGTLIALAVAYFVPESRLPDVTLSNPGLQVNSLNFASPYDLTNWHRTGWGFAACIAIAVVWMFAIAPKRITWRYGISRGCKLLWASIIRPRRKSTAGVAAQRKMFGFTKLLAGLLVVLVGLVALAWYGGGVAWDNLFGAVMGLAFGGGLVWGVRIVAGSSLGKEAMGFGDVTLMAMIGAWLGWQPALLVFAIAPFAALFIAVAQLLILRHTEIAFGPYLSLGALIVLVFWGSIWHDWAKHGIFALGPILLAITLVCLVLMGAMLSGWRFIKDRWFGAEE